MATQPDPIPPEGTPPPLTEGFLTAKEAAERMGLSVETVRAMCNDGSLSGAVRKQGRWYVPLSTVEAWGSKTARGTVKLRRWYGSRIGSGVSYL